MNYFTITNREKVEKRAYLSIKYNLYQNLYEGDYERTMK